jgi:hypothetical protein
MAIKPILFNTEMVRAILDGRKSCTRRICKDANEYTVPDMDFYNADRRTYAVHNYANREQTEQLSVSERNCPICPGDILYVRETFIQIAAHTFWYKAYGKSWMLKDLRWHPSIHMPKEAARIWLKVTDVRVERLQDITENGIKNEGIRLKQKDCVSKFDYISELYFLFSRLWDSTIKKSDLDSYGWNANPWVFVIEFERCEKPQEV